MKELSIEEKAKAYDIAIERLRNAFYDNNGRMCEEYRKAVIRIIEPIFPELKESSEDEKFRKYILKCCEETIHADDRGLELSMDTTKKLKNWLEKQGEKVEPIEGFNTEFERQISHLIASIINKEYEYTEAFIKWTSNALLNYAKRELEKQGEKKSEEEVDNLHNYLYGEQNLAWSEEDETILNQVITNYESGYLPSVVERDEIVKKLKSIKERVQPKQEWSEEDAKTLAKMMFAFKTMVLPSADECNSFIEFLKSIRDKGSLQFAWKPSEEQMEVLNEILNFAANHESFHWNDYIFGTLNELIRQLKKLREE